MAGNKNLETNSIDAANVFLIDYMESVLMDGRAKVGDIWYKFNYTYWIIVILSICMFMVGIALLSLSAWLLINDKTESLNWLAMAGLGMVDIITLLLFKPVNRLQDLMGDMGQMTITLNGYQTQKALILLGSDIKERATLAQAAANIGDVSQRSISLIETYFEIHAEDGKSRSKNHEDKPAAVKQDNVVTDVLKPEPIPQNGHLQLALAPAGG